MGPLVGMLAAVTLVRAVISAVRRGSTPPQRATQRVLPLRRIVWATIGCSLAFASWREGPIAGALFAPLLLVCFALAWPELFLELSAVRWGWARSAWFIERLSGGSLLPFEKPTSWAVPYARALVRRPTPSKAAFLERRLARQSDLPTTGAAALALLALQRGERDAARAVFEALAAVQPSDLPGHVRRLALDVLALDAVASRRLVQAARIGGESWRGALTRLVAEVLPSARRKPWRAWSAWLLAPARTRTRMLVRRALALPSTRRAPPERASFDAYVALLALPPGSIAGDDLRAAVRSLAALRAEPEFRQTCEARAQELGVEPEAAIAAAFAEAESTLARLMLDERMPIFWLPTGPIAEAVAQRVRDERFATLQSLIDALRRRLDEKRDFTAFEEWRAWSALRRASEEAASALPGDERLVFDIAYGPLTSYVVRLANVRSQRVMARAISNYLRTLAFSARAEHAYDLLDRNLEATAFDRLPVRKLDELVLCSDSGATRWRARLRGLVAGLSLVAVSALISMFNGRRYADGTETALLVMFGSGCLVAALVMLANLWIDVWIEDDELKVQNKRGCHVICAGDVGSVRALPRGLVWVRLKRKPAWVPHGLIASGSESQRARLVHEFERRR